MAKQIKVRFSSQGMRELKTELENYKKDIIRKCEIFVKRLAQEGIVVAQGNTGGFGKYITFSMQTDPKTDGCKTIVLATNTGIITSEWKTKDGIKTADVNPLLMVEFGSGFKAQNPMNVPGVGQGTFPNQQHAFDRGGWWYLDLNNEWHHSTGIEPKMPMYKARNHILECELRIAKEVFGG